MEQLILHLFGDYITQSHWMAENKTKRSWPALTHAVIYSLPFLLLKPSWTAFSVILITHFFIDRFRLARFVVYTKNWILNPDPHRYIEKDFMGYVLNTEDNLDHYKSKKRWDWDNCSGTGYPSEVPAWLSVWLLIAADNTLHLIINYCALRWL